MELGTAKFPVFSLVNREFDLRDEFAPDCTLSQSKLLFSLNFYIPGRGPKRARFPRLCGLPQCSGAGESREAAAERPARPEYLCRALIHWRN